MSPTKKAKAKTTARAAATAKRVATRKRVPEASPQDRILRSAHAHRSRAHTSSAGRRRQARRDTK